MHFFFSFTRITSLKCVLKMDSKKCVHFDVFFVLFFFFPNQQSCQSSEVGGCRGVEL